MDSCRKCDMAPKSLFCICGGVGWGWAGVEGGVVCGPPCGVGLGGGVWLFVKVFNIMHTHDDS